MDPSWQFAMSGGLVFGRGARGRLGEQLRLLGVKKPLVVTDKTLLKLPAIDELLSKLKTETESLTIFDGGVAEPSVEVALKACETATSANVDSVIGIGGGSNLDVAKMVSVVVRHGGKPADYFGFDAVPGPTLPTIAVPTTSGTGSEVSHSAVLTDTEQGVKVSTLSRWMRPDIALVDPALTDSCPRKVTAESGIDALVHAIEAYTNRDYREMVDVDPQAKAYEGSYPLTRLLAAEAIRLVGRSLEAAVEQPRNEAARDSMALAATLAGMAFSNSGVGIVHALEYPIGALTHCGHGEGNGLLLPHVMRFNLKARMQEFSDIAQWLAVPTAGMSIKQSAEGAITAIVDIQSKIGVRTRLRDLGMTREAIPECARKSFAIKRLMDINPKPVAESDLVAILEAAY